MTCEQVDAPHAGEFMAAAPQRTRGGLLTRVRVLAPATRGGLKEVEAVNARLRKLPAEAEPDKGDALGASRGKW